MPKYAVAVGRRIGIYNTYPECLEQVRGFPNAKFKKFESVEDAEKFIYDIIRPPKRNPIVDGAWRSFSADVPTQPKPKKGSNSELNLRISSLEERLEKYILSTNEVIEGLKNKIQRLEKKRPLDEDCDPVPSPQSEKKLKLSHQDSYDGFSKDDRGFVIVYTDGACSNNGMEGAKAGIGVWFGSDHRLNVAAPVKGPATNNNAEIQAAYVAIKQARKAKISKLIIKTDSRFLINCITGWVHKWKKNNWQLSSGGPVKNKDELVKLDNAISKMESVEWTHVAGHAGVAGNEMADRLARVGAEKYKQNLTTSQLISSDDDD